MVPFNRNEMIYLASPYSGDYDLMTSRYEQVHKAFGVLTSAGYCVYSPINDCHNISRKYNLPSHSEYWNKRNKKFLEMSDVFCILKLHDWRSSRGITDELLMLRSQRIEQIDMKLIDVLKYSLKVK